MYKRQIKTEYPQLRQRIDSLNLYWDKQDKVDMKEITLLTEQLFKHYDSEIMSQLNHWSSYEDAQLMFLVRLPFEEVDEKLEVIFNKLDDLIKAQKLSAEKTIGQMYNSFNFLQNFVKWLGIALVIGGLLTAIFTVRSIVIPVKTLKKMLQSMSLGILPKERIAARSDEIGEMGVALEGLVKSMESTTEFARQVGGGNFNSEYEPLSEYDSLGHALLKMRTDLNTNEKILEQKILERTEEVVRQSEEIQSKNVQLEILYNHVTDSIRYAKRIQDAMLPGISKLKDVLPESFIFFQPRDIVSGDFYWFELYDTKLIVVCADATGHGVPGSLMSMIGTILLKDITSRPHILSPGHALETIDNEIKILLQQTCLLYTSDAADE